MLEDDEHIISDEANFNRMKTEFKGIIEELPEDMGLYRDEFEKLYFTLIKSNESEERLVRRSKEILSEISAGQSHIGNIKNDESEAVQYRKRLQLDIEVAWSQVAESHKMESEKQTKLHELRTNIGFLKEQISSGSGWSEDQEMTMTKLKRQKIDLLQELEAKTTNWNQLKMEVTGFLEKLKENEQQDILLGDESINLSKDINNSRIETEKEVRRRTSLERKLRSLKLKVEETKIKWQESEQKVKEGEDELKRKELKLRETKNCMEVYLREYENLSRKECTIDDDIKSQHHINIQLKDQNKQMDTEVKVNLDTALTLSKKKSKIEQLCQFTKEKVTQVDLDKVKYEEKREVYKATMSDLVNLSIEAERKHADIFQKRNDDLVRERELLNKMLVKAGDKTQQTYDLIKVNENTKKNLQNEIAGYRQHVKKQRETVQHLVADRERYEKEAEVANKKYLTALEEVRLQEIQVTALQKKIGEAESKLKQQQNLYEAVRSDRNLYSKNLIESQKEIAEMKRRFKIMNHKIEQLKEEITTKDHALVKEHFDHHRVDKEKELLKNELTRIRKQIQSSEQIIANQEHEVSKLSNIIQEADDERQRQQKEYNAVINDRDNLRSQLIQRNEELHSLYEKIKIQKSTLHKGEFQYTERLNDIVLLKRQLEQLTAESKTSKEQTSSSTDLKHEIYHLERDLLHERAKIRALSDELERPLNIHRWRKLEGSDPKRYDMIRKIQSMRKSLIKKTEDVEAKELLIKEKETLYVQLKNILSRQPGPEVAEQLGAYKENLKQKQGELRAMKQELEMYKSQVNQYKREIKDSTRQMNDLKDEWFRSMSKIPDDQSVDNNE